MYLGCDLPRIAHDGVASTVGHPFVPHRSRRPKKHRARDRRARAEWRVDEHRVCTLGFTGGLPTAGHSLPPVNSRSRPLGGDLMSFGHWPHGRVASSLGGQPLITGVLA